MRSSPARPSPSCRLRASAGRLAALLLLLIVAACQPSGPPPPLHGVVIAVDARSIARADTLTLRADDGREYRLRVDPAVDWTPGHLREHMALGEPVLVQYRRDGDDLVAVRIDDG